ncbi:uncharacterized protein LOC132743635 [Ruditapes philippinarum]|uniref:uncharacterized protein LOC132743635 n=1 Tax=Ruditapes philippinarum TaxID=129788 RepID=UPI00295AF935|nr:uncharacterized protein LOC132743635 [Ruditapes philippinarum]
MEFEINETVINNIKHYYPTRIKNGTTISFSTDKNHKRDGACLGVFSKDQSKFSIACNKSTLNSNQGKESEGNENTSPITEAMKETIQSTPASISNGNETTERTTLKPTHSTMQALTDKVDGDNHIKKETTRQASSASISRGSQTTESTTLKHLYSTMQPSTDNVNVNPIISLFKTLLLKLI